MGGAVSSLDRQAVIRATEQPRFLMNSILEYIIKNIRENDVFRMQDPSVCKEFLLLSADSLDRLFRHIDVNPQTDRSGKIYFERVGRLTSPAEGSPAAAKRKLTCLAIAYFYVRILQIYLALAFTLIDDPGLMPGRTPPALGAFPGNRAVLPGSEIGIFQRGGAAFTFQTLIDKGVLKQSGAVNTLEFVGNPDLIIRRDSSRPDRYGVIYLMRETTLGSGKEESKSAVKIHLKDPGTDAKGVSVPARITIVGIQKLVPQAAPAYGGFGYPAPPAVLVPKYNTIDPPLQLDLSDDYKSLKDPYKYDTLIRLNSVFQQLLVDLENPSIGESKLRSAVSRAEQRRREVVKDERTEGVAAKAAARVASDLKEGSSEKALKFQDSIKLVASVRPLAHCITRSFQLLDVDALGPKIPKSARTHICQSKFETGSGGYLAAPPETSIAQIPGLQALNFLFFVLEQIVHLSGKTEAELKATLDALSQVYGGKALEAPKVDIDTMASIRPRSVAACEGRSGRERFLNPSGISVARAGVGRLWAYQRAHAAKVEGIFRKLFNIGRSGDKYALAINENLFKKGIPEVEKISDEARALLTDYYGECETIYQDTVRQLDASKFDTGRESAIAPAPAAAAPKPKK